MPSVSSMFETSFKILISNLWARGAIILVKRIYAQLPSLAALPCWLEGYPLNLMKISVLMYPKNDGRSLCIVSVKNSVLLVADIGGDPQLERLFYH